VLLAGACPRRLPGSGGAPSRPRRCAEMKTTARKIPTTIAD
jgi:hypothetical protein